jgi:chromosome segregation ATPase
MRKIRFFAGYCCFLGGLFLSGPAAAQPLPAAESGNGTLGATYEAAKEYTFEKKDEFVRWADARSQDLDQQIEVLSRKIEESRGKARSDLEAARGELERERRELAKKMEELRQSSEKAWEEAKWGLAIALDRLEQAYRRALSRFGAGEGETRKE